MANLHKGFPFVDGQQLTAARLNALVDSATIDSLVRSDFTNSVASPVSIGDVSPSSPNEGETWFDTSLGPTEGKLRVYDGAQWIVVAEGMIGYNGSGSTIVAGSLVKPAFTTTMANMRLEIALTTSKHDVPVGMVLADILAGATGIVLTKGKVLNLLKATGTAVTAGDFAVPSATSGQATTSADANFGKFYGSGVFGIWTKDQASGATSGEAMLIPRAAASGWSIRTPSKLLNAVTPTTNDAWSGSFSQYITWSVTPPGVIARLVQWRIRSTAVGPRVIPLTFGLRQASSGLDISTGTVQFAGVMGGEENGAEDGRAFAGLAILPTNPAGDGTDRAEYLVAMGTYSASLGTTIGSIRLDLWEVGAICGGRIP